MRGVLLTGGRGTRLGNLTKYVNKHLLQVGSKPMVEYPLGTLRSLMPDGDICTIYNDERMRYLGSQFEYIYQPEPLGTAEAIYRARKFVGDSPFLVLLGDNLFLRPLAPRAPPEVWVCEIPNRGLTVLGAYYLDKKFFDYYPSIIKSGRGEFETVDVLSCYDAVKLTSVRVEDWIDMGSPEGILKAEEMVGNALPSHI